MKTLLGLVVLVKLIMTIEANCPDDKTPQKPITNRVNVTVITNVTIPVQAILVPVNDTMKTTRGYEQCIISLEDCQAWYNLGERKNNLYYINPDNGEPFLVYCDMETDDGGWTVFQRRIDGSVDFYRGWSDYEQGFGNLTGEFWLGLTKIHRLTASGKSKQLRIDLGDFENNHRYAKYSDFSVGDDTTEYTLTISGYSGNAGDTLLGHWEQAHKSKFTTKDNDNDSTSSNCAVVYSGAWWYHSCHGSNLNGLYLGGTHSSYANGVEWTTWKGYYYSLRFTEMKLK